MVVAPHSIIEKGFHLTISFFFIFSSLTNFVINFHETVACPTVRVHLWKYTLVSKHIGNRNTLLFYISLMSYSVIILEALIKMLFFSQPFYFYFTDPDLEENDGIYSRYLTEFPGGVARYSVSLEVDDNQERAFSYQRVSDGKREMFNLLLFKLQSYCQYVRVFGYAQNCESIEYRRKSLKSVLFLSLLLVAVVYSISFEYRKCCR